MIKRRITIHSTKSRVVTIKGGANWFNACCKQCGEVAQMVGPDEAAAIVQVSSRAIYRAIEAGEIHFLETPVLMICCNSLFTRFADPGRREP